MNLLFIVDPLAKLKIEKDSSVAMMAAAQARGHRLFACQQDQLSLEAGRVLADVVALELTAPAPAADASALPSGSKEPGTARRSLETGAVPGWYRTGPFETRPLTDFDAVVNRKDPPFDMEYVYTTYLLEHAARAGARVFNDPAAVRSHNEKFSITEFPELTTDVLVTRDPARIRRFVEARPEAVLKLLDGMGGASIFRVRGDDPNLSVIIETMNRFGSQSVMAQTYLPAIKDGDKRVLLIDGEVVPYCLARIPRQGESRGNLAAGGTGVARPLSASDRRIAEHLAPILAARGLFLVGLDVIGESLTEINVTSPTCFREIADQTGFDVAGLFIERLERRVGAAAAAAAAAGAA